MKKAIAIILTVTMLLGLTGCAEYKETIAQQEQEIAQLEESILDLQAEVETHEDEKALMEDTIEKLEAVPTCTPKVEGCHLGVKANDLCQDLVSMQATLRTNSSDYLVEMPNINLKRMVVREAMGEVTNTSYIYEYDTFILTMDVDPDGHVTYVKITGDGFKENDDRLMMTYCLMCQLLANVFNWSQSEEIAEQIMDSPCERVQVAKDIHVVDGLYNPVDGYLTLTIYKVTDDDGDAV